MRFLIWLVLNALSGMALGHSILELTSDHFLAVALGAVIGILLMATSAVLHKDAAKYDHVDTGIIVIIFGIGMLFNDPYFPRPDALGTMYGSILIWLVWVVARIKHARNPFISK